ncbi:MAG: hypothetical protein EBR09_10745 [Proteobacteria bacterium]|nr:hypothetical protein [Pseudomonadota bacterium]
MKNISFEINAAENIVITNLSNKRSALIFKDESKRLSYFEFNKILQRIDCNVTWDVFEDFQKIISQFEIDPFEVHKKNALEKLNLSLAKEIQYFERNRIQKSRYRFIVDYDDTSIFKLFSEGIDEKDRQYRNSYFLTILRIFENRCARCKMSDKGVHFDHFMIPRNRGGTFELETHSGFRIHNALPLCESCNTSKGERNFRLFFSEDELIEIFEKMELLPELNGKS